ncbi:BolA family protein [Asticcacaulis sp. EMRT-3]|uniref:BolA family protein n=1 Tax=Asticcacaulis sp. EMRT-3 TaxID=3040349 RepID=UPI0024AF7535|nr:BolA family protein [Asticcacaulis sp. EMRT-3]MDI7773950.1 BolA family protein [Asticcacaulis sp. EMRT-3]
MGIVADRLKSRLDEALQPQHLEIHDDSAKHSGHAGARKEGESHFSIIIVSERFRGLNRVARQRLVNQVLAEYLAGPVHALSLKTLAPEEFSPG